MSTLASAAPVAVPASRLRTAAYWATTVLIAGEMALGSAWDLGRVDFVRQVFDRLGYPYYLLTILGLFKLPCALTLVIPRVPRLKEWAYAGAVFNYTGAWMSHLFIRDPVAAWLGPLVFALILMASYLLRPASRRL